MMEKKKKKTKLKKRKIREAKRLANGVFQKGKLINVSWNWKLSMLTREGKRPIWAEYVKHAALFIKTLSILALSFILLKIRLRHLYSTASHVPFPSLDLLGEHVQIESSWRSFEKECVVTTGQLQGKDGFKIETECFVRTLCFGNVWKGGCEEDDW